MTDANDSGMIGPAVTHGIVLKNDEREHARLHEAVDAFAKRSLLSDAESVALQFCLEEAFLNIVKHGFDDVDEHEIDVQLHFLMDKRVLLIWIVDDGKTLESVDDDSPRELDQIVRDQSSVSLRSLPGPEVHETCLLLPRRRSQSPDPVQENFGMIRPIGRHDPSAGKATLPAGPASLL